MVFGLFTRKSTQDDASASPNLQSARLPTPTPSIASVAHHSPLRFSTTFHSMLGGSTADSTLTDSVAEGVHPPPPETPTPPPSETKALYDLMLTIPPKTLHAYTLAHLCPRSPLPPVSSAPSLPSLDTVPRPPSPNTATKLAAFFSTLAPPPLLHCVRCHKDFYEIENEEKDKACHVPHDDESALVSRVSGGGYETLWGCCGQTASGDGSEGPPDGWCYEGRHTTDIRRARFRADATLHDDKLASCLRLNCHGIRDRLPRRDSPERTAVASSGRRSNVSPVRSQASRTARKRPRKSLKEVSGSENEGDAESTTRRPTKTKPKDKAGAEAADGDAESTASRTTEAKSKDKADGEAAGGDAESTTGRTTKAKPKDKADGEAAGVNEESTTSRATKAKPKAKAGGGVAEGGKDANMVVDEPNPPSSKPKTKTKSRPISRARPPASTSTVASLVRANATPISSKAKTTTTKPKSISRTLLSQSQTHPGSDSEESTRPRTRSIVREESRGGGSPRTRTTSTRGPRKSAGTKRPASCSEDPEMETGELESEPEPRGRDRKRKRVRRD